MPLRLEIQRVLSNRSERVKAVDFHPTECWLLAALYNGNVCIWNYETQQLVKTFEACELPVRAAKFIARKSWLITGSDDLQVRVFNYNTMEKVKSFEAHVDYIRSIAVHATQPLVLTSSDDTKIKLWDWDKGWKCVMTFEGHSHFVMHVAFNPKDSNTFASASMDRTIKVWSIGSAVANYTLEGHQKGLNCVEYYEGTDKPYLISGADDKLIKVWDYQNKTCVHTLEGHTNNVMRVIYHPSLPIIISASEDGTIRIWHANTYRLENTLNYGMERVWCLAYLKGSNYLGFGYDEGTICIKLGKEFPAASMDSAGKIIWANQNEIQLLNVQQHEEAITDGQTLVFPAKDLGNCEVFPQTLVHSPNGRFVVVCGDGEFIIYTALAWRNKAFGQALEFVWAQDSNEYAIRESSSKIKLFKSFKEKNVFIRPNYSAEGLFGGNLLGVKSSSFLVFYDWETGVVVRRIDIECTNVFWANNDTVAVSTSETFFVLKFHRQRLEKHLERGVPDSDEGFEDVFEILYEINEAAVNGTWVDECFIYITPANRLNYLVGNQPSTLHHFSIPMFILGYSNRDSRIFVCDRNLNIMSYSLPIALIAYQSAVLRKDNQAANELLQKIPQDHVNRVARFLETQGRKEEALKLTTDPEHRFELAMALEKLNLCYEIALKFNNNEKWQHLGDLALSMWNYEIALESYKQAGDVESAFLIMQACGDSVGLKELSKKAGEQGEHNIQFLCLFLVGDRAGCLDLLVETNRLEEAAQFAYSYMPSHISRIVELWKISLEKEGKTRIASKLADPISHPHLFPDHEIALKMEKILNQPLPAAHAYRKYQELDEMDLLTDLKNGVDITSFFHEERQTNGTESQSPIQKREADRPHSPMRPANGVVKSVSYQKNVVEHTNPLISSRPTSPTRKSMDDRKGPPLLDPNFIVDYSDIQVTKNSDANSQLSLDVNTTGTGSVIGYNESYDEVSNTELIVNEDPNENLELDDEELDALLS